MIGEQGGTVFFLKMVFFGRKEKIEDRRLLASIDAVNGAKLYHIENGKKNDIIII